MHAHSSSSSPAAHHDAAVVRDDFWVQIMSDERSFFWNRQERQAHWEMPPGIRPGWVMTPDDFFVHTNTRKVLKSLSGIR